MLRPIWSGYGTSSLASRVGANAFVRIMRKYENADPIIREILGRRYSRRDESGRAQIRYEHSMRHHIRTAADLSYCAEQIDRFIRIVGAQNFCYPTPLGYLANKYGIESLPYFARQLGGRRMVWNSNHRLNVEEAVFQGRSLIRSNGFGFFAKLHEIAKYSIGSVLKNIAAIQEVYPVPSEMLVAMEEIRQMVGESKLSPKGSGEYLTCDEFHDLCDSHYRTFIEGLFAIKENRELLKKFGLEAFKAVLEKTKGRICPSFFTVLGDVAHLIGDRGDFDRICAIIATQHQPIDEVILKIWPQVKGLIGSEEDLKRLFAVLHEQAGKNSAFLDVLFPEVVPTVTSMETLVKIFRIAEKIRRTLVRSVLFDVFREMACYYAHCGTPEEWESSGFAWARFFEHESIKSETAFYGSDPEEREKNKNDRAFVLRAIKINGHALAFAAERFREDKELVLAALETWPVAFRFADAGLRRDLGFQKEAFAINFNCFRYIESPPQGMEEEFSRITAGLAILDISFPGRFNTKTAEEIIKNRERIAREDARPILIVFYPKNDWNDALENNQLAELIGRGYRVLYFEIGHKDDVASAKKRLAEIPGRLKKEISLILGAHSSITRSAFGAPDPALLKTMDSDYYFDALDLSNGIAKELAGLGQLFLGVGSIIVEGCGAGGGQRGVQNVANALAKMFPRSKVIAPTVPTYIMEYVFDTTGKIIGVRYPDDGIGYIVKPKDN